MDCNPYKENDAKIVNKLQSNRWNHRPGVVKLGGYNIACSFHTKPHDGNVGGFKGLGWKNGHMCIHVLNSYSKAAFRNNRSGPGWELVKDQWKKTARKRGSGRNDATVKAAYEYAPERGYVQGGNWKK